MISLYMYNKLFKTRTQVNFTNKFKYILLEFIENRKLINYILYRYLEIAYLKVKCCWHLNHMQKCCLILIRLW